MIKENVKISETHWNNYPKLMISRENYPDGKCIILVKNESGEFYDGTCLHHPNSSHVGLYSTKWKMKDFCDFKGSIKLDNEKRLYQTSFYIW